ncbi:MAG TPA: POTRA domain-containing protein [Pyrinomonadaceae bacterium]|nr:POTRA domain-containing protein [Pyrinomonadaceae bacterium]
MARSQTKRTGKQGDEGSIVGRDVRHAALVVSVLLAALVSATICSAQKQARLTRIEVVGLKRITQEQVIATSQLQIGQTVDPSVLDAAAEKLIQSGLFKTLSYRVRSADDQATVIFEVEEAAKNLPVVFENFVWFADDEISRAIRQDVPFFDGTAPQGGSTANKIAAALQRLLDGKRIPARVEFLPYLDDRTGMQELLFTAKGVKIPVCDLHFPGAEAIPETDLIKASQQFIQSDYSKKDAGQFGKYTLFPLYRRIGRLRATFQEPTAKLEPEQCTGGVAVTIPVEEGLAYSWDKAEWNGNQALTVDELSAALGMKTGELADGFKIDKGMKDVHKAYGRRGYIAASIRPSIEFDDASSHVSYRFNITEGPRYFMGKLIVNGLPADDEERLRAKWTLGSNAVFDASYIDDFSQKGLREFMTGLVQRSPGGPRAKVDTATKPDAQKQTVDVIITFKSTAQDREQ